MEDNDCPSLSSVAGVMAGMATAVQGADAAPTQAEKEVCTDYRQKLDGLMSRWKKIERPIKK